MALQTVTDLSSSVTVALGGIDKATGKPNPKTIDGFYLGTREVPSKYGKDGKSKIHILQTKTGNVGVWGKTHLDGLIAQVERGVYIHIKQEGESNTRSGNPMKLFIVKFDPDNRIPVTEMTALDTAGYTDGTDNDTGSEPNYGGEDETDVDADEQAPDEQPPARAQPPRQPAKPPTSEQYAKAQALLSKNRKAS